MSNLVISAVGLSCKAFLKSAVNIEVNGLPILLDALNDTNGRKSRGIVTVSNHISALDEPLTWGILPASHFIHSRRMTRWSLGAADVCFTNPLYSVFFRLGQVLETFRGKGIYQKSVDTAIHKLDVGEWIHLFGEGKVNQPNEFPEQDGVPYLPRFKWGVGRIVTSTHLQPLIIPMWITGFDQLMPEGRPAPYRYLPRIGVNLSITFGQPIQTQFPRLHWQGPLRDPNALLAPPDSTLIRAKEAEYLKGIEQVTTALHDAVEMLGRSVDSRLNKPWSTKM